jgi:hypothetical protein
LKEKAENKNVGAIAPEQSFQNPDHCESTVNHALKLSNTAIDWTPNCQHDANHRRFALPLAQNHPSVQRSPEFQENWKGVSILFRSSSPEAVQAE